MNHLYLNIAISGTTALLFLVLAAYHGLIRKIKPVNLLFAALCLDLAVFFSLLLTIYVPGAPVQPLAAMRIMAALALAASVLLFTFASAYPYLTKKAAAFILAAALPGVSAAAAAAFGGFVIDPMSTADRIIPGPYAAACGIMAASYSAGFPIVLMAKSLLSRDRTLGREMALFAGGFIAVGIAAGLAVRFPLPAGFMHLTPGILAALPALLCAGIIHYAASNTGSMDFARFFSRLIMWFALLLVLFVPVLLLVSYPDLQLPGVTLPAPALAFIIFLYQFLIFKYLKPRMETLFQRRRTRFTEKINRSFLSLSEFEASVDSFSWNDFFRAAVQRLVDTMKIDNAELLTVDRKTRRFQRVFLSENSGDMPMVTMDSEFTECLYAAKSAIISTQLFTDQELIKYRDAVLEVFTQSGYRMAVPMFDFEQRLIGLLLIGKMKKIRSYSFFHLSSFDLYRIQFQQQILNAITLEEAKDKQAVEHDRLVMKAIKKMIIPERLIQIEGIRVSSMYISNSDLGCDYFDSIVLDDNNLALFLANSSYTGIDSAISSLQLYSSLHTPTKHYDSPEKILGIINWIVTTSGISSSPIPCFALIYSKTGEIRYSSASANPLVMYNPASGVISIYETKGTPLGVSRDSQYESGVISIVPGSVGFICSSGLFTSINQKGETYSIESVKGILAGSGGAAPDAIVRKVYEDYSKFIGNKKQMNDITFIVFKV